VRGEPENVRQVQQRIDAALASGPADLSVGPYSDYLPDHTPALVEYLMRAAKPGGLAGIKAALREFDRLAETEHPLRIKQALMIFLTHHPEAARLGLRIPPLDERAPWMTRPSEPG
jgi:hypothetical protein